MRAPVGVHAWPQCLPQALADLHSNAGFTVISVPTPLTASRAEVRQAIRHALQSTVAAWQGQPLSAVTLLSNRGQPVQVMAPGRPLHVAISHMSGVSVAAICTRGAVGVDVMGTPDLPDWAQLAHDYLGPQATLALQQTLPAHRPDAFAQAWVSLEARLKCLGLGLTEWAPALEQRLAACDCWPLEGLAGVVVGAAAIASSGR